MLKRIFQRKPKEQPKTMVSAINKYGDSYMRLLAIEKVSKTGLLLGVVFLGFLFSSGQSVSERNRGDHVSVLELKGEVSSARGGFGYNFVEAFAKATKNQKSAAILIHANSPGGSPVQAEMMYDAIRRYTATPIEERQPVYVSVQDACASACLYAIAAADRIYVHRNSLIGSIGVRLDSWDFSEIAGRLGIGKTTLTSGEHKALLDPFSPSTPEQLALIHEVLVTPLHQQFVADVKASRGDRLQSDYPNLFSGMVWGGVEALDIGLADEIMTTYEIEVLLKQETGAERILRVNREPFSLTNLLASAIEIGVRQALLSTANGSKISNELPL